MKKYQKTALLEVIERTSCGGYLVQNEGDSSDRWVIPQDTFESTYQEVSDSEMLYSTDELAEIQAKFGFDIAICLLKEGEKVARAGWNGKGMWLALIKGDGYSINCVPENERDLVQLPWIAMKTADNKMVPWLASQTDVLAVDWEIAK